MEAQTPIIDVRKVLREKAPRISKKIPACIVNYLIRTIHQDELNRILQRHAALDGVGKAFFYIRFNRAQGALFCFALRKVSFAAARTPREYDFSRAAVGKFRSLDRKSVV